MTIRLAQLALRRQGMRDRKAPITAYAYPSGSLPAFNPVFSFVIAHRPPPFVSSSDEGFVLGDAKRKPGLPSSRHQLRHRLPMTCNHYGFTLLDKFQKAGELGLGLMHVDLHMT